MNILKETIPQTYLIRFQTYEMKIMMTNDTLCFGNYFSHNFLYYSSKMIKNTNDINYSHARELNIMFFKILITVSTNNNAAIRMYHTIEKNINQHILQQKPA